ncbi:MAG: hypothetical protein V4857_11790 [Pseudomonadota bacterium]
MKSSTQLLALTLALTALAAGAAEPDVYAPVLSPKYAVPAPKAEAQPAQQPPGTSAPYKAAPPKKAPPRRRPTRQDIITMPPAAPIVGAPFRPSVLPPAHAAPSGPVQINSCDAGGCTDTNGVRYNGGAGNAALNPQGRLCTTNGATVQCF